MEPSLPRRQIAYFGIDGIKPHMAFQPSDVIWEYGVPSTSTIGAANTQWGSSLHTDKHYIIYNSGQYRVWYRTDGNAVAAIREDGAYPLDGGGTWVIVRGNGQKPNFWSETASSYITIWSITPQRLL